MARNYNDYIAIKSKFDSDGTCGHRIRKGDDIGYSRTGKYAKAETQCAECWRKWSNEVATERDYSASWGGWGGY